MFFFVHVHLLFCKWGCRICMHNCILIMWFLSCVKFLTMYFSVALHGFTVQVIRQVYDLRVICMWALDLGDCVCWLNSFIFSVSLRLRSVKNIQKITKSMKMVSAAKFGRAERELRSARVYGAGASGVWPV